MLSLRSFFFFVSLDVVFSLGKVVTDELKSSGGFPDLLPLVELMNGGKNSNPRRIGFRWTTSEKVDVIAVDIFPHPPYLSSYHIKDLPYLKDFCASKVEPDVALRVFLVEDMTAVVVETLGASFALPPGLFNAHMRHMGNVQQGSVGEPYEGAKQPCSRFRDPEFFSFAFQRKFDDSEIFKSGPRQRHTMHRDQNIDASMQLLEERVSGIICSPQGLSCRIGSLSCFLILQFSRPSSE